MLLNKGHKVFLYGAGYCDIEHENLEFVQLTTMDDIRSSFGVGMDTELGYDYTKGVREDFNVGATPATVKFRQRAYEEIGKRKKDSHFLLLSMGGYHRSIATLLSMPMTVEPGIGYFGSWAKYRAFESRYLQNFTYGAEHPKTDLHVNVHDRVIPNYFDLTDFEFNDQPDEYLLFIGRLVPHKGYMTALRIASDLNMPIKIAGQGDTGFLKEYPNAEYVGVVGPRERKELYRNAKVTLVPTKYLEPFGGVAVESMLSGTPVVATDFGAFVETVSEGISGYRANTIAEFINGTRKAMTLDRSMVRSWALQFSMENIADMYENWWNYIYTLNSKPAWYKSVIQ